MKRYFFIGIMALLVWACSTAKGTSKASASLVQNNQDSTKYDLVIDDIHFDQWYRLNYSAAYDHANDYYRSKDNFAVTSWNDLYNTGRYSPVIDCYIYYQPNIDYGIDLNRKLFCYFKYIQETYRIPLLFSSPDPI